MNKIYKSLADGHRRAIIKLLLEQDLSVNAIVSNFSISQATVSSHLSYLRLAGLVGFVKKGKERIYFVKKNVLFDFIKLLNEEYDVYCSDRTNLHTRYFNNVERRSSYNK